VRAINHAFSGALIGLSIANPVSALPLAFVSHFVVDAIPHFGVSGFEDVRGKWFNASLILDAALCVVLVGFLAFLQPRQWLLAAACAFLATSPDFMWVPNYLRAQRGTLIRQNTHWLLRLHANIQWFERPIGGVIEVVWFVAGVLLISTFVRYRG
jgi:hypothetical protein